MSDEFILRADHLVKCYPGGEHPALNDVSLGVKKGEFLAVVGQSGSGKSTLLSVLSSLTLPDSGSIIFNGQDIVTAGEKVRNHLRSCDFSFIFQQHHLMPYLNALENVLLPYMNRSRPIPAELKTRGREVLERVGLGHKLASRPGELSGGEQQRVAIARALVRNASLLFADEPTGSLDSATGEVIMELLHSLNSEGLTVIMVTHNDAYAARADRTVRMKDGEILSAD